jgi:sulfocyanin SoxE-like protein
MDSPGIPMRRCLIAVLSEAVALFVAMGGRTGLPASSAAGGPSWMHIDAANRHVTFVVTAAQGGANGTLNFNGYARGQMTVTVPSGWRVHIDFDNSGAGALPHSLEVIRAVEPVPPQAVAPAIPKAQTSDLVAGTPPQQRDSADFTAAPAGAYLWFCGVPTHGTSGMWDRFVISAGARLPSVKVR